ncbi:MAG: hypothetical protein HQL13_07350, partial [Candidatus Omnitrophica bacterium]|nr:hypothetical protein [Candidatus Omnitrophota bacterium]
LAGSLNNFKKPAIRTTLSTPGLELEADMHKTEDSLIINSIKGKYLGIRFNSSGDVLFQGSQTPVFNINAHASLSLEDVLKDLPEGPEKALAPLNLKGIVTLSADIDGHSFDWKDWRIHSEITSPVIRIMGYKLTDFKIIGEEIFGKVKNLTLDGQFYAGTLHALGNVNLLQHNMPYDLALNIENTDLHQFKLDSPLKMQDLNGKFFLTFIGHGSASDFKNTLSATGALSIRNGYLGEFDMFKGLLSVLNDALHLGGIMITDVAANFTIENQKINTEDLRLKGPTLGLLGKGWVGFDQTCDLNITVDLGSSIVPDIAHDLLQSVGVHIYDKITAPKFKKKISMPQVINSLIKKLWQ